MKALIVSYMFPPVSGGGTQRPLKFVKYLPSYGVTPVVVCPRMVRWKTIDHGLLELPFLKQIDVHRCGIDRLQRYYDLRYKHGYRRHPLFYYLGLKSFFTLDFFSAWYRECRTAVRSLVEHEQIDCVVTTSPPNSVHLFGRDLARTLALPWIVDIRDAIVDDPNQPRTIVNRLQAPVAAHYERTFFASAAAVVTVSEPMQTSILQRHPGMRAKLHVIENGFDPDDFDDLPAREHGDRRLTITYTGSFMGMQTPAFFLKAIDRLVAANQINPIDIRLIFVGDYDTPIRRLMESFRDRFPLEVIGFQPHKNALALQAVADILLLIVNTDTRHEQEDNPTMTGKFFEYIGARRPIFALVPDGPLKRTIENGRFGVIAPPRNITAIADRLKEVYETWKRSGRIDYHPDEALRNTFSRRTQIARLAGIIKGVVEER